ncbi:MAG: hypothetical protein WAW79_01855, partial [Steroidobacteraceae bacterium]
GTSMNVNGYDYISERDFDEIWGARVKANGELYSFDEAKSFQIEHVWTVSEGEELDDSGFNLDGHWYASPGISAINALGYLVTARPWVDEAQDAIWYFDDDDQAREDRRQEFSRR